MGILDGIVTGDAIDPDEYLTCEKVFDMMARSIRAAGGTAADLERFADRDDVSGEYAENIASLVKGGYIQGSAEDGALYIYPQDLHYTCAKKLNNYISDELDITEAGEYTVGVLSSGGKIAGFKVSVVKGIQENKFDL